MTTSRTGVSFRPGSALPAVMRTLVMRASLKTAPKNDRLASPGEPETMPVNSSFSRPLSSAAKDHRAGLAVAGGLARERRRRREDRAEAGNYRGYAAVRARTRKKPSVVLLPTG
jgi:hypothetical protein